MAYDLHSPFDFEQHKKHFINYFEAAIFPDGHIEYCIPSHTEFVYKVLEQKGIITRDEIMKMDPSEYDYDALVNASGLILCWSELFQCPKYPTLAQIKTLNRCIEEGLTTAQLGGIYE